MAMIISWAWKRKITPLEIAKTSNRMVEYEAGLEPLDARLFDQWGMTTEAPQTFTADGFMDLLEAFGPIWVAAKVKSPHVRVVTGFEFSNDPYAGPVHINDPWQSNMTTFLPTNQGSVYSETYADFARKYEALGFDDLHINSKTLYPVYFAHLRKKPS